LIAVAAKSQIYRKIKRIKDLDSHWVEETKRFFISNNAERDKKF